MSSLNIVAPPVRRTELRTIAYNVRRILNMHQEPYFQIPLAFEAALEPFTGFVFDIVPNNALPQGVHGETRPDEKLVLITKEVYERAVNGRGRDRMTMAHEFGHALLHGDISLARRHTNVEVPAFRDPEWQAKAFAGELLVCSRHVDPTMGVEQIAKTFGVSEDAARHILKVFRDDGLFTKGRGPVSSPRPSFGRS